MHNKNSLLPRLLVLFGVLALCMGITAAQLFSLQMKHGDEYVKRAAAHLTTTTSLSAARGEILDRYGREMVSNKAVYSLSFRYADWDKEGQVERILELSDMVSADGGTVLDVLPISQTIPFVYIKEDVAAWKTFEEYVQDSQEALKLPDSASADMFLGAMRAYLKIPESYTAQQARTVIGVYYGMRTKGFSMWQNYQFATEISIDLIAVIKENHQKYAGVAVETEAGREYATECAPHLLGTVGPIFETDWEKYRDLGYMMNDIVGKSGLEAAEETQLHGSAGATAVDTEFGTKELSEQANSYAPAPGNNVITTIDLDLQAAAERALEEHIAQYGYGGAAVVLDANTSEVLAMASYPDYDLATYNKNYDQIQSDERKPEVNRATSGLYAPGSTFKILTAIGALEEGLITEDTYFTCTGSIEYGGQRFKCNNPDGHGTINVTDAIKYSCNVYFYEVGKLIQGEGLEKWCKEFGLGEATGIEIGETTLSKAAGPTSRAAMRKNDPTLRDWQGGDDVQAAIGQSDNVFTPLQLANYLAAVVNGGTLHRPSLVKSVKSYNYDTLVSENTADVLNEIPMSENTRRIVMEGMGEVTAEGGTAATVFADYPVKIGGKTGTVQTSIEDMEHGTFIAFAPYDNPEIVISVVGEAAQHGSFVAPVVKDILDCYFETAEVGSNSVQKENGIVL